MPEESEAKEALIAKARDVDALFYALVNDVIEVTKIWEQRSDQLSERLYIRTAFAMVEGVVSVMKSSALIFDSIKTPSVLSAEEILLLREEDPQIGRDGRVEIKKRRISLLPNLEFTLKSYAKVKGVALVFDKSGKGWASLIRAIKIRDRLMHPHSVRDLDITEEEMDIVHEAMRFFRDMSGQLVGARRAAVTEP